MSTPNLAEALERLESEDAMLCQHAAADLGDLGDPAAIAPLMRRLSRIDFDERNADRWSASYIIEALRQLKAHQARDLVFESLEQTAGDDVVPPAAFRALRALGDATSVAKLKSLVAVKALDDCFDVVDLLETVAAIGGVGEQAYIESLLKDRRVYVKTAALEALGNPMFAPSAAAVRKLTRAKSDQIKFGAFVCLARMGVTGSDDLAKLSAVGTYQKSRFLAELSKSETQAKTLADWLFSNADNPAWATAATLRRETLETAAVLGSTSAREELERMVGDTELPLDARAMVAARLVQLGSPSHLEVCLQFLRFVDADPQTRHADAYKQEQLISFLEKCCKKQPGIRVPLLRTLDGMRREKFGNVVFVCHEAGSALRRLTKTDTYAEFDAWIVVHS